MKLKLSLTLAALTSAVVFSGAVFAQKNYKSSNDYVDGVTIYEHCDFKGKSQTLSPGEYGSLRRIGFGNDSVSSIRVPRGNEAIIYRDDDYRGAYARIDRDIRCFDKQWNDEASSIRVREVAYSNRDDRRNSRNNSRNNYDRNYGEREYDGRDYDDRRRGNRRNNADVTAKNIAQVVFDGVSLQQVSTDQWSMDSRRGQPKQFQEVRRSEDSVYLENKYTAERVRIDLFANDVTLIGRDGRQQRYSIDRKNAALGSRADSASRPTAAIPSRSPNTRIRANCFNFKAYTKGGSGGLRFYGKDGFHQFANKAKTGRICHNGPLTMEIGKTSPKTNVTVEIDGRSFRFAANEKEDKLLNNWYRKNIKLQVGK